MKNWSFSRGRVVTCALVPIVMACLLAGCHTSPASDRAANPVLRRIDVPVNASRADTERAYLARLVGAWTFDGWALDATGTKVTGAGRAAGVIENEHFVLLDLQVTSGQFAGHAGRKSGSLLFASEPDTGLTITGWGDGSPTLSRLSGHAEGSGSAFVYHGSGRAGVTLTFETDDRFVAEITDSADGRVSGRYIFTRGTK